MSVLRLFMRPFAIAAVLLVFALGAFVGGMAVQSPAAGSAATTAKSQALIDLTGYWVSMENDNTLRMDIDAGMQTRLFHFDGSRWKGGVTQLQGDSVAAWGKQVQRAGAVGRLSGAEPGKGGACTW
jgi:hypothetical protein